jgi:trimeric autotransporter adhesin
LRLFASTKWQSFSQLYQQRKISNIMRTLSKFQRTTLLFIPILLSCFAFSPMAQAIRLGPDRRYAGYNTAQGDLALQSLRSGATFNTAVGGSALSSNTTGGCNTATGTNALRVSTTGMDNTADGVQALASLTAGNTNTALGYCAGVNLTAGDKNIYIGNLGVSAESDTIRIGSANHTRVFMAGIYGVTSSNGAAVYINPSGQLGTAPSSVRFKEEIEPMDKTSEAILALRPVTFRYKKEIDPDSTPQFGLVAEQVEKVNPDLVARDSKGKIYTVRYEAVNAMLLNEFLKEHRTVEQLKSTVAKQEANAAKQEAINAELKSGIQTLTATTKKQASQIQKMSAQFEASKVGRQVVNNP